MLYGLELSISVNAPCVLERNLYSLIASWQVPLVCVRSCLLAFLFQFPQFCPCLVCLARHKRRVGLGISPCNSVNVCFIYFIDVYRLYTNGGSQPPTGWIVPPCPTWCLCFKTHLAAVSGTVPGFFLINVLYSFIFCLMMSLCF